ncbi:MAG: carbohydrate ABC transporter permease, partial [Gammaproteobacteria bacterium]
CNLSIEGRFDIRLPVGALFRIVLPLARPGIVATAIFAFINSWKDFLLSFLIANESSVRPLAIGLYEQVGGDQMVWGDIMAWSSLMTLPILVFFLLLQRHIVHGLTAGAVKG